MSTQENENLSEALSQRAEDLLYEQQFVLALIKDISRQNLNKSGLENQQYLKHILTETTQHGKQLELTKELHVDTVLAERLKLSRSFSEISKLYEDLYNEVARRKESELVFIENELDVISSTEILRREESCSDQFHAIRSVHESARVELDKFYSVEVEKNSKIIEELQGELKKVGESSLVLSDRKKQIVSDNAMVIGRNNELENRRDALLVEHASAQRNKEAYVNFVHANKVYAIKLANIKKEIAQYTKRLLIQP